METAAGGAVTSVVVAAADEQNILYAARTPVGIREHRFWREGEAATSSQVAHEQLSLVIGANEDEDEAAARVHGHDVAQRLVGLSEGGLDETGDIDETGGVRGGGGGIHHVHVGLLSAGVGRGPRQVAAQEREHEPLRVAEAEAAEEAGVLGDAAARVPARGRAPHQGGRVGARRDLRDDVERETRLLLAVSPTLSPAWLLCARDVAVVAAAAARHGDWIWMGSWNKIFGFAWQYECGLGSPLAAVITKRCRHAQVGPA